MRTDVDAWPDLRRARTGRLASDFAELGASVADDIPELEPIETTSRALSFEWDEDNGLADTTKGSERKAG